MDGDRWQTPNPFAALESSIGAIEVPTHVAHIKVHFGWHWQQRTPADTYASLAQLLRCLFNYVTRPLLTPQGKQSQPSCQWHQPRDSAAQLHSLHGRAAAGAAGGLTD